MAVLIEFVIFGGLAYWLFSDRARAVVSFIFTKLQEVYNRWETQGKQKKDKTYRKEKYVSDMQVQFNNKTEKRKPTITGFDCAACSLSNRGSLINKVLNTNEIDILNVENLKYHPKGYLAKLFPQLCQALSFKRYQFSYIYESVLKDEKIQEVYETAARVRLEDPEIMTDPSVCAELLRKQKERAAKILTTLRSTFSDTILRISSYVMSRVMMKLFSKVVVNPAQIEMLHKVQGSNLPLIFLPLHRSHLDYIIITFILANNNMKSPLVAAGENLRIPFFGSLLRGLGAFFIKRRMDPVNGKRDILYRALLHTYMIHCLSSGHNFEFFIEGGRTRSGKPCMPKGGLLSVFLDAYMDGTIDDALLVPVSINYDRLVDGNFVREQMGQPKQMETFSSAISAIWKAVTSHYGAMRVDFNQPFSLAELVKTFENKIYPTPQLLSNKKVLKSVPSTASLYGTDVVVEEHRQMVDCIARHVIYDCSCSTAVMSTNAVGFLLCNAYREGVQLEKLAKALDELRDELFAYNKSLGFNGKSVDVIKHAVKILGPKLVNFEKVSESESMIVKPVTALPNIIELSYYSNTLLPHYVLEAVVVRSMYSLSRNSGKKEISHAELLETCHRLCDILRYEFIFSKYCQSLDANIMSTIEVLTVKEVISSSKMTLSSNEEPCQEESEENKATQSDQVQTYMENSNHHHLPLYKSMLQPYLDVYTTTCLHLYTLLSRQVPEKDFAEEILQKIKTQVENGELKYGESVSVDTIRNCLKLLEKWNVLESHNENRVKIYCLGDRYEDETAIQDMVSQIKQFQ